MFSFRLESADDSFDLSSGERFGYGVQALAGATGLGLPPVSGQWLDGAGDGSRFRGGRTLARDMDFPLDIVGRDRDEFEDLIHRLSVMLTGDCTLVYVDGRESEWATTVRRVGGGDWVTGVDTKETDLQTVVTLRAGDPYFTNRYTEKRVITADGAKGLLTGSLTDLSLSSSQAIGTVTLDNLGDAIAYPVWRVNGPGRVFQAIAPDGQQFTWNGTLTASQWIEVDTRYGTVIDNTGANRYDGLAARPRMWGIPVGTISAVASVLDAVPLQTKITCSWQNRKLVVV